ncbi:hypothetical protein TRIUR3_17060 [Triticum urartu]|uniref:Uncharacterized protein n=1 Tax=Triticum urartu TaxID=4572 RepID=M7ZP73_TRIUA|nr:hypothetical protein TRIUR3_17060 [Triticum urartu]
MAGGQGHGLGAVSAARGERARGAPSELKGGSYDTNSKGREGELDEGLTAVLDDVLGRSGERQGRRSGKGQRQLDVGKTPDGERSGRSGSGSSV